jgi:Domain of unknown function (DUF4272)
MISDRQLSRKQRSEAILHQQGVPFIDHLPVIEADEDIKIPSVTAIAQRAMALCIVAVKAEGLEQPRILEVIDKYQLEGLFTPAERQFIHNPDPSDHERTQLIWRYESYWVLLWALNYIEELSIPDDICDVPRSVQIMVNKTAATFIQDARLRSPSEILDAADLIYRYHWACVDHRVNGLEIPAWLDRSVVFERHYALNWLIGYADVDDWDNVPTDT